MPQIRPITDLRNTGEISDLCHAKNEPIFITKNGYGDLVVMSIQAYENIVNESSIDAEIELSEKEFETSACFDAQEALSALRLKSKKAIDS